MHNLYLYFQYILVNVIIMDTEKTWKKKGRKSSLTLHRQSQQFCVKNPLHSQCVQAKHDTAPHHDHDHDHGNFPTMSKYKMCTTCGVQTACSMLKIAVASIQTKSKCTKSLHCQTEWKARKSVSTQ